MLVTTEELEAWRAGWQAYYKGVEFKDNPYDAGDACSSKYDDWSDGWSLAASDDHEEHRE